MEIEAAVLRDPAAPFKLELLTMEEPRPREVLVRIVATGMCHTDIYGRSPDIFPGPVIYGHEGAGVVEFIGSDVTDIEVGDHVILTFDHCGRCTKCRSGHPAYCEKFYELNIRAVRSDGTSPTRDGNGDMVAARWFGQSSFASHVIATSMNCIPVDRALPLEMLAPLGCAVQTGAGAMLGPLGVGVGSRVAVFGVGSVGMAAIMASKVAGASVIAGFDRFESRLEFASRSGATHVLQIDEGTTLDELRDPAGPFDVVLDTTGNSSVILKAVGLLQEGGTCGLVGINRNPITLPTLNQGRSVVGITEGDTVPHVFIPQLIELWTAGLFPFDQMNSSFPMARINEAEEASQRGTVVKPVLLVGN